MSHTQTCCKGGTFSKDTFSVSLDQALISYDRVWRHLPSGSTEATPEFEPRLIETKEGRGRHLTW